jgi:Nif-specific regulatory protein
MQAASSDPDAAAGPPELVIVQGPGLGARYRLDSAEIEIGKAPACTIALGDPAAGWKHCSVRRVGDRFLLTDYRTPAGIHVNGKRVWEHWLADGDQFRIGETVLLFRKEQAEAPIQPTHAVLLRACTLLFLFRALAMAQETEPRALLETQLIRLIGDLIECDGGYLLLGRGEAGLKAAAEEREASEAIGLLPRLAREGAVEGDGFVLLPLFVRGELEGALAVKPLVRDSETTEILSAIATLGSAALENAKQVLQLEAEKALLSEQLRAGSQMVGKSLAMERLETLISRVAPRDTTVLILGESGTGKELVAREIHQQSARTDHPFVAINCAALTETLLESELFGHEKGAFTGAVAQKKGKLEVADGGTVFLDEIGEMAPALQAKLLRVLQQREFQRVGGTRTLSLDVRLIAATNRDLAAEVKRGAFREDLYHRLNVVALRTPPLRERREDVVPLALHFLGRAAARSGRRVHGLSAAAERCLTAYSWPGNVRELENAIERAVVLGDSDMLLAEDLPETVLEASPAHATEDASGYYSSVGHAKRDSILRAWRQTGGDYKAAAQLLGLHPNSLLRLVRRLGLREELEKGTAG